jgi:hypothetical protein
MLAPVEAQGTSAEKVEGVAEAAPDEQPLTPAQHDEFGRLHC